MAKKKVEPPAQKSALHMYDSSFRAEIQAVRGRYGPRNAPALELLNRLFGYARICVEKHAAFVAPQTMRLYQTKRSSFSSRSVKTIPVSGAKRKFLTDRSMVGVKSAIWADQSVEVEEVVSAPILNLLHNPNQYNKSSQDHWYLGQYFRSGTGNSFQYVIRDDKGTPVSLHHFFPQNMRYEFRGNELVFVHAVDNKEYSPEDIWHQRFAPSPYDPVFGSCPLQGVLMACDILNAQNARELAFQERGARPDYAIEMQGSPSLQQMQDLQDYVMEEFGGPNGSTKPYIFNNATIKPLGFSPKDLEGQLLRKEMVLEILGAYGVPESELAINSANLASSTTGNLQFHRNMRSILIKNAEEATDFLVPLFYPNAEPGEFFFCYDDTTPPEAKPRVSPENEIDLGLKTRNEWRRENGYEAVEGGDVFMYRNAPLSPSAPLDGQKTPAAEAMPSAPAAQGDGLAASLSELAAKVTAGELPASAALAIARVSFPSIPPEQLAEIFGALEKKPDPEPSAVQADKEVSEPFGQSEAVKSVPCPDGATLLKDAKEVWRKRLHLDIKTELPYAEAEVKALEKALAALYKEKLSKAPVSADGTVDLSEFQNALEKALADKLPATFLRGRKMGVAKLSETAEGQALLSQAGVSFDVVPDAALQFLDNYTIELARSITQTEEAELRESIAAGMEAGETVPAITERVQAALGEAASWKAERIARSETARAYISGQTETYKEAGCSLVEPLLAPNPCSVCQSWYDSNRQGIDINRTDLYPPQATHPSCRCDVVPVVPEGDA